MARDNESMLIINVLNPWLNSKNYALITGSELMSSLSSFYRCDCRKMMIAWHRQAFPTGDQKINALFMCSNPTRS